MEKKIGVVFGDIVDKNDPQGRTFRQINAELKHNVPIGALVELKNGIRLFVISHGRDCDGEHNHSSEFWLDGKTLEISDRKNEVYDQFAQMAGY